jgi:hypothetical protein
MERFRYPASSWGRRNSHAHWCAKALARHCEDDPHAVGPPFALDAAAELYCGQPLELATEPLLLRPSIEHRSTFVPNQRNSIVFRDGFDRDDTRWRRQSSVFGRIRGKLIEDQRERRNGSAGEVEVITDDPDAGVIGPDLIRGDDRVEQGMQPNGFADSREGGLLIS